MAALVSQLRDVDREGLSYISYFLFFVLAILVSVVGMNALIAIMGDTYARVADPSLEQAVLDKEIGSVLVDRLRCVSGFALFRLGCVAGCFFLSRVEA